MGEVLRLQRKAKPCLSRCVSWKQGQNPTFLGGLKTHTDIVMVHGLDHQNGLLLFVGRWLAWFLWFHAQNAQNVRLIEFRINQCVSL